MPLTGFLFNHLLCLQNEDRCCVAVRPYEVHISRIYSRSGENVIVHCASLLHALRFNELPNHCLGQITTLRRGGTRRSRRRRRRRRREIAVWVREMVECVCVFVLEWGGGGADGLDPPIMQGQVLGEGQSWLHQELVSMEMTLEWCWLPIDCSRGRAEHCREAGVKLWDGANSLKKNLYHNHAQYIFFLYSTLIL